MSKFAWVTLTTNDTYSLGALVLAHSLRRAGTVHQLAVLVTPSVSEAMRDRLKDVYNVVQEVNVLDSQDAANLALLARPELGITFTKLHCWRLVQFEKCVFLDADTLVLKNSDELFEREELSAAPDVSWPDCFNSGVFVYKPSLDTFTKITEFALKNGSFDGGDQGLLNQYFADWAHTDIQKHLPFIYNVTAYASYCYLPAFKQFKDKIKILHFAGKLKPWLIPFDSQSKTVGTPSDYAHAHDLIQLWWTIFCDNVHQKLSDNMREYLLIKYQSFYHHHLYQQQQQQDQNQIDSSNEFHHQHHHHHHQEQQKHREAFDYEHVKEFRDPWEDYYEKLETESNNSNNNIELQQQQEEQGQIENVEESYIHNDDDYDNSYDEDQIYSSTTITKTNEESSAYKNNEQNEIQHHLQDHQYYKQHQYEEGEQHNQTEISDLNEFIEYNKNVVSHSTPTSPTRPTSPMSPISPTSPTDTAKSSTTIKDAFLMRHTTKRPSIKKQIEESIRRDLNRTVLNVIERSHKIVTQKQVQKHGAATTAKEPNEKLEAGLAGALAQLRLGAQRTPEQAEYENLMRRQCWESGQIDYAGRDSFDNIWKKISETLDSKPGSPPKETTTDKSELLTSADIEDGKIEHDRATGATIKYKVIDGGYEVITTTPQSNGTVKTQVRTFWDPKPVSEADLAKEAENRRLIKQRLGKEIRIDSKTTMLTRAIEGGYEEVYTTINDDGTKSSKTKTFFDSVPTEVDEETQKKLLKNKNKQITRKSSVDSTDSTESRRVVQKVQQQRNVNDQKSNYRQDTTIEETRRVTQNIEITENNRTVRKNSLQEQSLKAITQSSTDGGKKKRKPKSSIPPPPADFVQNETTTVSSRRVPGGSEYTYSTKLESGKTITTSKTVYEEEEVELTEEEIKEYKKTLKDAEKHKNITTTKKLRSESGTKKVVPSENPGDVTTVETIKIEGGTEYHYTTVTAEGIVKKSVKTVYDPVSCSNPDDSVSEEEVVEEYEEEIIEPGEKNIRTIETVKQLPKKFEEEVTITHEKKEKKVKKSMVISH